MQGSVSADTSVSRAPATGETAPTEGNPPAGSALPLGGRVSLRAQTSGFPAPSRLHQALWRSRWASETRQHALTLKFRVFTGVYLDRGFCETV